ncbi:MAG: hypothetical protein AAFV43_14325 [Planctomycetota bacterium]
MANKLYVVGILLLWAGSMSWLVSQRILPPLVAGESPPNSLLHQRDPVAWRLSVDGSECGTAVLQALVDDVSVTEIHSRLLLDRLPQPKGGPPWLAAIGETLEAIGLDVRTRNVFDPLGQLARFSMSIEITELNEPITLTGRIDRGKLKLRVRSRFFPDRSFEHDWPEQGLLATELMPESKVLSVYMGRKWRKEVFSPFAPPSAPVEVLDAEVVEVCKPMDDGKPVRACRVEFRSLPASGVSEEGRLRGTMVVSETGRVLQHEKFLLGSRITFDRLSDRESIRLAGSLLELDRYAAMTKPQRPERTPASE